MQIEIDDFNAQRHTITTRNMKLAADWLADKCRELMSANASLGPCRIHIWPQYPDEMKALRAGNLETRLTRADLLYLSEVFQKAAFEVPAA